MCDDDDDDDGKKMANSHTYAHTHIRTLVLMDARITINFRKKLNKFPLISHRKRNTERGLARRQFVVQFGKIYIKHNIGMAKQRVGTFYDHIKFIKLCNFI